MTRHRKPALPIPPLPPPPAPSSREAWDALLASLPLTGEQRAALTIAADDLALDAAEAVAAEVSRLAHDVGNAAVTGCMGIAGAAARVTHDQARAARTRQKGTR